MDKEINQYLFDILSSIAAINEYLDGQRSFKNYQSNKMLRRAIEREFEIIGEAMYRIIRLEPIIEISSKERIISMRNRVIHGYDKIDDEVIWGTIIKHLPILKNEVEHLLN